MTSTWIHIPTPGDHYSAATGSAVMTVIYELSRCHARQGGQTRLIVGKGTRHDYPIGECSEAAFGVPLNRNQKIADIMLGRLGLPRFFASALYRPAEKVLNPHFEGMLCVHNGPAALNVLRRSYKRARIALYCHNVLFGTYSRAEVRRTLDNADLLLCVSDYIAKDLQARCPEAGDKIRVVLNGVDTERFRPAPESLRTEPPLILFVGRVTPEKGPDLLIKAAANVFGEKRTFKVRIVGSSNFSAGAPLTPYELELRRIAAPLGDAVTFHPFVDRGHVLEEYRAASIFCAPSNWDDPCPLIVPEAMACGLPVIASRRGGIPEEGGDAILYFQPPDVDELACCLAYFLEREEERLCWGQKARKRAEQLSWETQYAKLVKALEA